MAADGRLPLSYPRSSVSSVVLPRSSETQEERITTNRVPCAERTSSITPLASDCFSIAARNSSTDFTGFCPTWTITMPAGEPDHLGGAAVADLGDHHAFARLHAEFLGHVGRQIRHLDAQLLIARPSVLAGLIDRPLARP